MIQWAELDYLFLLILQEKHLYLLNKQIHTMSNHVNLLGDKSHFVQSSECNLSIMAKINSPIS